MYMDYIYKHRLYLLIGVIIINLIDYISIFTDAELFNSFCRIIYIYIISLLKHHNTLNIAQSRWM